MKRIQPLIALAALFLGTAAFSQTAQPQPDPTDWKTMALTIRTQRDSANQALEDTQIQVALLQQQLKEAQEKIAALTAQKPTAKK